MVIFEYKKELTEKRGNMEGRTPTWAKSSKMTKNSK